MLRDGYAIHRDECNTCNIVELCDIGMALLRQRLKEQEEEFPYDE